LLDLGFEKVVGQPSCSGGTKLLVELVKLLGRPHVVIVADGDEPGQRGADNLAAVLRAYAPSVQVIGPPEGIKDLRAWRRSGGSRFDLEEAITAAPAQRGVICPRNRD
jgi:DNA primase